jgi:hypothetical protein
MLLNAVGVFSFLPAAFAPGFVLRVSRSSTLGLGLLCIAWAVSLAVEFWRAATRCWAPVRCLETGRVLAGSMKVANDKFGKSNPVFSLSTGGVTYNTGAAKASKNGVRCGQVQKALENQANPAGHRLSVIGQRQDFRRRPGARAGRKEWRGAGRCEDINVAGEQTIRMEALQGFVISVMPSLNQMLPLK